MAVPPTPPGPVPVERLVSAARAVHEWFTVAPHERAGDTGEAAVPDACPPAPTSPGAVGAPVPLPGPAAGPPTPLSVALRARRSRYDFADAPVTADDLGTLLGLALGVGRRVRVPGEGDRDLGLAPSAGGLPSLDAYVVLRHGVCDAVPGVHRYGRTDHTLVPVRPGDPLPGLRRMYLQPEFAARPAVSVVLAARLDRTLPRYGLRHYTTLHVDAGVAVQNLYLVASALGLAGCAVSGIRSRAASALLALPDHSLPLIAFAVGPTVGPAPAG